MEVEPGKYMKLLGLKSSHDVRRYVPRWVSDSTDARQKARSAVLDSHAVIEELLKRVVYEKLSELICVGRHDTDEALEARKKKLWKAVGRLSFGTLHNLLSPALDAFDREQFSPIAEIHEASNSLAHGSTQVAYKGKDACSDPECLAQLFFEAFGIMQQLDEFMDFMIEHPRAERREYAELRKRHPAGIPSEPRN